MENDVVSKMIVGTVCLILLIIVVNSAIRNSEIPKESAKILGDIITALLTIASMILGNKYLKK